MDAVVTRLRQSMAWAVTSLALALAGCGGTVIIDPGNNGGNGPDDDTVILRIQNSTRAAVRPQIYVGTNGADATADNLFVPANIYTNGVGLAGSGLMAPVSADDVEVPCFADLVIGTPGGEFLDDETGESLGAGPRRILQQGLVFDCGAEITLTFRETEDGYTTTVELN